MSLQHQLVFVAFGLSGAAALIYEVVWTRKLVVFMGASTYSMSTILAAFMAGLALGGAAGGAVIPRLRSPVRAFAFCELAIGVTALLSIPIIGALTGVYADLYFAFRGSFAAFSAAQFALVFSIVLVPATLMGMTFPLVIRLFADGTDDIGRRAGFLYGVNTLGAVIGSTAAGFVLLPGLGGTRATLFAAGLNFLGGLAVLIASRASASVTGTAALVALAVGASTASLPPSIPYFSTYSLHRFADRSLVAFIGEQIARAPYDQIVLFRHEGVESDVAVMRDRQDGSIILSNNGKLEGGAGTPSFPLLALLPYASRRWASPPRTLSIGLGSGETLKRLAAVPHRRLVSVELSEGVLEAARRFFVPELFGARGVEHVRADGRHYLLLNREPWDLLVISPSWAVEMASANLMTEEFFALAAARLSEAGVLALQLDLWLMADEDVNVVLRGLREAFPHAQGWNVAGTSAFIVLASKRPFGRPVDEQLAEVALREPALRGVAELALTDDALRRIPNGPHHTDDRPFLEFRNARHIVTGL